MTKTQKKPGTARIIALIAAGICPLLLMLLGLLMLLADSVMTVSFAITFFVLPCAAFAGCFFEIRSKHNLGVKVVLCALLLIVMVVLFVFLMSVGHFQILTSLTGDEAVALYQEDTEQISVMPAVSDLGQPEKIEYHYFYNQMAVYFDSECHMLFCQYTESDYQFQLDRIEEEYAFQIEAPAAHGYSMNPVLTMDGYTFRFLSFTEEEYHLMYPKYMAWIATNGQTNEVVYMFYDDDDLDWIESMEEHILEDCGWKYIR